MRGWLVAAWMVAAGCGAGPSTDAVLGPQEPSYGRSQGKALGTTWSLVWAPQEVLPETQARALAEQALAEVDQAMSTWRDDSDLMAVRQGAGPVVVHEETAEVVRSALALAEATSGAFDPTVQPLMELWGLHGTPRTTWPTDEEVDAARASMGWTRVVVDRDPEGRPTVDAGGTALDLSAIAKGHAVDRVYMALVAAGATDLLVEVGGEVRTAGRSPRGGLWSVGVDRPVVGRAPGQDLVGVVEVSGAAVATSGNYRNALTLDGRTVHHTMDPRTGRPAESPARSATVLAPDTRTADGWATALMVLGEEGLPLIEARPGLEAWLLVDDGDGALRARETSGMAARLSRVALGDARGAD